MMNLALHHLHKGFGVKYAIPEATVVDNLELPSKADSVVAALIPIHYPLAIGIDTNTNRRSLNMLCKIIFLNDMRKNENGDSFVNRCIRLGGSYFCYRKQI
jgi:hypothetical protein